MRTIKYRGKDEHGCWHVGWLVETNDGTIYIAENDEGWTDDGFHNDDFSGWYKVLEKTIGQFTGLTDKNGEEIYEGDLVKYTRYKVHSEYLKKDVIENVYVVHWNEEKHAFYCTTKFESGGGASGYLNFHDERAEKEEIEVIGNIHDNPELLEGGNDE